MGRYPRRGSLGIRVRIAIAARPFGRCRRAPSRDGFQDLPSRDDFSKAESHAILYLPDQTLSAKTIATVEARHGAFLNVLVGRLPFPDAFDGTRTQAEINDIVEDLFIVD